MNGLPRGHVHAFAYDALPNLWRCECGETMGDEHMPAEEIFAERQGEARIDFAAVVTLPDNGRTFVAALKAYAAAHPKLDVVYLTHTGGLVDELVIRWRWRP